MAPSLEAAEPFRAPPTIERGERRSTSAIYTKKFQHLQDSYRGQPIEVRIRELVGPLPADDLTHSIFPYPARLLRQIPRFFLGAHQVMDGIDYVLDPFCGSGTILIEAQRYGYNSYGFDQNPIGALATRVKTTYHSSRELRRAADTLTQTAKFARRVDPFPSYLVKWYCPAALSVIARLVTVRNHLAAKKYTDFLDLSIALLARRVSAADPKIPVPVRLKSQVELHYRDVWTWYEEIVARLIRRIDRLRGMVVAPIVHCGDARGADTWSSLPAHLNGLVFTSPPYGASQKYIRSCSLEAGWLGYSDDKGTINLERASIGREHVSQKDPMPTPEKPFSTQLNHDLQQIRDRSNSRYNIYLRYFCDMATTFDRIASQPGLKAMVVVAGDNVVAGLPIQTNEHLKSMAEKAGFEQILCIQDSIGGRTLLTRRQHGYQPTSAELIRIFKRRE